MYCQVMHPNNQIIPEMRSFRQKSSNNVTVMNVMLDVSLKRNPNHSTRP